MMIYERSKHAGCVTF